MSREPDLKIVQGHQSPDADLCVVIDVVRAFTTTHVAFLRGAEKILLCRTVEEAFALKKLHPKALLMGEVAGLAPPGFDLGNSPRELYERDFRGHTLIHRSSNGTQGAIDASRCPRAVVTGFSNARTTAGWLRKQWKGGEIRSVVFLATDPQSDDDVACAEFMRELVIGAWEPSVEDVQKRILMSRAADRVRAVPFLAGDLDLCVQEKPCDFVMEIQVADSGLPMILKSPA